MRLSLISIIALTALQLSSCDYRSRYEACTFLTPPSEAQPIKSGEVTYLIFPASVSSDYTGCQKAWLSNGHLQASLKYTQGLVTRVELTDANAEPEVCLFRHGELLEGEEASCLPYKRWKFSSK